MQENHIIDAALATMIMHAIQIAMHNELGMSPGAFVFQRDMFLNVPLIANLQTTPQRECLWHVGRHVGQFTPQLTPHMPACILPIR
jgi:hypothetical protein